MSFTLREDSTDSLNKALSINFDDKDVNKFVPQHVTENCHTVVNMNL